MAAFSETVREILAGREVIAAPLIHFDFLTDPKRIHLGYGTLRAGGYDWEGIGEGGSMQGLEAAIDGTAPQATFSLSGVETTLLAATFDASNEVKGRDVTVFVQFYTPERQRLDDPCAFYFGVLDVMSFRKTGPGVATVTVTSESLFARRAKPMWGGLSDRDQKRLYPGDRGLEMIAQMANKTAYWPIIINKKK